MASGEPQLPTGALRRSLGESLRSSLTFDPSALRPLPALRGGIGIAIAIGGASALFGLPAGVAAAVGALLTGRPAVAGTNRRPLRTTIAIAAAVAVSIFVASASAHPLILHLGLLGLWAFAGGLLVALGDAAAVVGPPRNPSSTRWRCARTAGPWVLSAPSTAGSSPVITPSRIAASSPT